MKRDQAGLALKRECFKFETSMSSQTPFSISRIFAKLVSNVQNENGFQSEFNPDVIELFGRGYNRELVESLT